MPCRKFTASVEALGCVTSGCTWGGWVSPDVTELKHDGFTN